MFAFDVVVGLAPRHYDRSTTNTGEVPSSQLRLW